MPSRARPHISDAAKRTAIEAITQRRNSSTCDDPHLHELSDDPLQIITHVTASDIEQITGDVVRADVLDALTLLEWARQHLPALPGTYDKLELELLEKGLAARLTLHEMAAPMGLSGRGPVQARLQRGRAGRAGLPRSETAFRSARVAERHAEQQRKPLRDWAGSNAGELLEAARLLLQHRNRLSKLPSMEDRNGVTLDHAFLLELLADQLADPPKPDHPGYADHIDSVATRARMSLPALEAVTSANPDLRNDQDLVQALGRLRIITTDHLRLRPPSR